MAITAKSARRKKGAPTDRIRTLRLDIVPKLGTKKLAEVTDDDAMKLVRAAVNAGRVRKPSKLYDEMRAFFNWAASTTPRYLERSPLTSKRPEQNGPKDRVLTVPEIRAVLVSLAECPMTEPVRDVCRLILRLGQRVNEVCAMKKRHVRFADDVWVIPATVAKNSQASRVPLPPKARAIILAACQRSKGEWVFMNKAGNGPLDPTVVAKAVLRSRAVFGFVDDEGEPHTFSSHDLRRTCATYLEKLGTTEKVIAAVLNHKSVRDKTITSSVYARDDLFDPAYDALCRWEVALDAIDSGADPFNVSVADRRQRAAQIRDQMSSALMLSPPSEPAAE